jgi:hypothetical protein
MYRIFLIISLLSSFLVGDSFASGVTCRSKKIRNLTDYNIENCENTKIKLGNKYEAKTLKSVQAANNQISQISDDTFRWATELIIIDLRANKIEQISVEAFKNQGKLRELYLGKNNLTRIEVGTFDSLVELEDLRLDSNQLFVLEKGLFDKNKKLDKLFMDANKIVAIEPTVFRKLNQAVDIHLSGNLCANENFQGNRFDENFVCFKNYDLFKQQLEKGRLMDILTKKIGDLAYCEAENSQLKLSDSKLINCDRDKLDYIKENLRLKNNFTTSIKDLSQINFDLAKKLQDKESELRETLEEKSTCLTEKDSSVKAFNELSSELANSNETLSGCQGISIYILIGCVTVESLIIIIFMWKCGLKNGKVGQFESNNELESQPAIEKNPAENNLIYATLDLKPTNKTPIRTDEVIYSDVQALSRPNESAAGSSVSRNYKK